MARTAASKATLDSKARRSPRHATVIEARASVIHVPVSKGSRWRSITMPALSAVNTRAMGAMETPGAQEFLAACGEARLGAALGTWFPRYAGMRRGPTPRVHTGVESMPQPRFAAAPQDDHVDLTPRV